MRVGDIQRWNSQADAFGGQYRLVANLGGGQWEIEHLPADEQTTEAIFDYWALAEANNWGASSRFTYEQRLEMDLARYAEKAGQRMTVRFVSRKQYAKYF